MIYFLAINIFKVISLSKWKKGGGRGEGQRRRKGSGEDKNENNVRGLIAKNFKKYFIYRVWPK